MLKKNILLSIFTAIAFPTVAQYSTSAGNLRQHVSVLASDSLLGRGFGTQQGAKAAEYIAVQFREAGIDPLKGSYFHPFNHRTGILNIQGINVAGIIPGSDPALNAEYIVLGAHYDHLGWKIMEGDTVVYNGADDNASGTASMIEIGRNLAGNRDSIGRSIIFVAFDGEESGLVGSRYFLDHCPVPVDRIKLMFSLDMVGMYEAHKGLDMSGLSLLRDPGQLQGQLAAAYGITVRKAGRRIEQRTDTAPFGSAGIPAIHATTGVESPYHKPEDVTGGLDFEGMAQVASFLSASTAGLSTATTISDFSPPRVEGPPASGRSVFRTGIRVNVGSGKHNYQEEFYMGKSIFAAGTGLFANIRATRFLYIQPEVLYETKGSRHPDGSLRAHSITMPLNFQITPSGDGMLTTYFQVGGYYSYHFGGRVGGARIDFQDVYNKHEFGLTYGFGFEVMNVQLGMYIQNGLSSLLRDKDAGRIVNENVYFMLGFLF